MADDDDKRAPWWIWVLVALGIVGLGVCAFGGYLVYQFANYNPTAHYHEGEPPPCVPGPYLEVRGTCPSCPPAEGVQSNTCLYEALCIDSERECLQAGRCMEMAPQRIDWCGE